MRTAVDGDEDDPRPTANTFTGTAATSGTGAWSAVYFTSPTGHAQARARAYRTPWPNPPGPGTVPAPEPLPEVLRWECRRLDRPPLGGR